MEELQLRQLVRYCGRRRRECLLKDIHKHKKNAELRNQGTGCPRNNGRVLSREGNIGVISWAYGPLHRGETQNQERQSIRGQCGTMARDRTPFSLGAVARPWRSLYSLSDVA